MFLRDKAPSKFTLQQEKVLPEDRNLHNQNKSKFPDSQQIPL